MSRKMKEQIISTYYHIGIDLDFENIFSYCKFTEDSLEHEKVKFDEIYKNKVSELNAEEKEKFEQFAIGVHWKLHDVFPVFQWSSIFNSAFNMFEKHINDLCKIYEKETTIRIGLKDLKGQGIERAKLFLSKVIGITNVFDSKEWSEIQDYLKVRNVLVHTSGELDLNQKKHKEVFDYAKNHPKLILYPETPVSDSAQVIIMPDFIYEALICYRIILGRICKFNLPVNNGYPSNLLTRERGYYDQT